ncbi:helix-turn-helix domain-containing protein [Thermogemmatispora carboxidivorans]|uniref:helix-turn-helix domain-containing protein n=1 Tax=Thermogemmatispora carboxidivorans TaxID=1382306 RepID=UPI00138DFF7F|nr:helix-turn-helix transcriptional regulator [Thermogemmatispora carboxidivorans]
MLRLRIKEVAREKGVSINQLSQRAEVSYNIVKAICRNPYRPTNTATISRIAQALGVPTIVLLEEVSEEEMAREQRALATEPALPHRSRGRPRRQRP